MGDRSETLAHDSRIRIRSHERHRPYEKSGAKRWDGRPARGNKSESMTDTSSRAGRPCHFISAFCSCAVFTPSGQRVDELHLLALVATTRTSRRQARIGARERADLHHSHREQTQTPCALPASRSNVLIFVHFVCFVMMIPLWLTCAAPPHFAICDEVSPLPVARPGAVGTVTPRSKRITQNSVGPWTNRSPGCSLI
jgi:hypothetical protein